MEDRRISASPAPSGPTIPHWSYSLDGIEVRFVGRTPQGIGPKIVDVMKALRTSPGRIAWLRQCHSARVRKAKPGPCGDGDGLWTTETGLALCIVTADCVPIVCASRGRLAVVHAGWRGLEARVIEATLRELPGSIEGLKAWLGPAIGPCCYEVGDDIAERVSAASSEKIVSSAAGERPHLDLQLAAEIQLRSLGVQGVQRVDTCTSCHCEQLWSYRRNHESCGRNLALAWLAGAAAAG